MEAELVEELPTGEWQYEPKWDGFRGVLENLGGRLEFDQLQLRLHPAESRIRRLAAEIPAEYVAFDVLVWKGEAVHQLPLDERRQELVRNAEPFRLSPVSREVTQAAPWLDRLEQAGLYGDGGSLDFVGHCSGFPAPVRRELEASLPAMLEPGHLSDRRIPGGQSRWSRGKELDWNPVRPELVCEVRYDKLEGNRFRHGTRFLRFRPDKDASQCTWDQVRPRRKRGDPTVESLLGAACGAGLRSSGYA